MYKMSLTVSKVIGSAFILSLGFGYTHSFAHPEVSEGNCHFHTSSGEQHCADGGGSHSDKASNTAGAVVKPLLPTQNTRQGRSASATKVPSTEDEASEFNRLQREAERAQLITDTQMALARLGYESGPPTGKMNGLTELAIKQFQKDNFLPTSGQPSLSLLAIIESEVEAHRDEFR